VAAGPVWTSDLFYGPDGDDTFAILAKHGVLAVEMEVAALYAIAAAEGVRALGLLAVSDDIARGQMMSSADRETSFDAMFRVALSLVE
jgi:purine-nucleoside phosphorylase